MTCSDGRVTRPHGINGSFLPSTPDQGPYYSCYAASSAAMFTARLWIRYPDVRERWQREQTRVSFGWATLCSYLNNGCNLPPKMGGGDSYWVMADIAERGAKTDACIPDKCIPQNKSAPHKDARCSASALGLMSWRTASWRMENLQSFGGLVLGCVETNFASGY